MICLRVMQSRKQSAWKQRIVRIGGAAGWQCFGDTSELPATSKVSEASEVLADKAWHGERFLSRPLTVLELEW